MSRKSHEVAPLLKPSSTENTVRLAISEPDLSGTASGLRVSMLPASKFFMILRFALFFVEINSTTSSVTKKGAWPDHKAAQFMAP